MKIIILVFTVIIFNLSLFSCVTKHFEGSLEYKITQSRKLNNTLNLDSSHIDSLEKK